MGYFDIPLTVWGLWLTAILNAIFLPVLGAGCLLLLFDRVFGTHFFSLEQLQHQEQVTQFYSNVFWIFGHLKFIFLFFLLGEWLQIFFHSLQKASFRAKSTALSMTTITILSTLVYGHHMFTTSMSPL